LSLYLGLISGTSMDGIDAVLLEIESAALQLRATVAREWSPELQRRLRRAAEQPETIGLTEFGALDTAVAIEFATAALQLLRAAGITAREVRAIGSHGQTVLHQPKGDLPFTLQIGDPNILAERTGIDVVADFRRRDIAAGGEGAPLMPAFHAAAFSAAGETRALVNIGGLANVTLLKSDGDVAGFDTGPGNCLLDAWARRNLGVGYDKHGAWAASGNANAALLARMLAEPYFARPPPKSTGRETFSDAWLEMQLQGLSLGAADVQATLAELTARSIAQGLCPAQFPGLAQAVTPERPKRLLVCGGGAFNTDLMHRLTLELPDVTVQSTADYGIAPDHVEAAGFAWLAHRYLCGLPGNIPAVTGARRAVPLGALYRGTVL